MGILKKPGNGEVGARWVPGASASRGVTVVEKEVQGNAGSGASGFYGEHEVELPVVRSSRPGTLDLSNFDFDDLLA
jgi:hypothetical protein